MAQGRAFNQLGHARLAVGAPVTMSLCIIRPRGLLGEIAQELAPPEAEVAFDQRVQW